jgi:hypothetical protein
MLMWSIDETAGFDAAWATLEGERLYAEGRACALQPTPYWIDYSLETADAWVTARVSVRARWDGGEAALDLRRDGGRWTVDGDPRPDLDEAFDCDLAACPLTNTMPILRHSLHRAAGDHTFVMAFIEVPNLRVDISTQRYTHVRVADNGARVRFQSGSFESELTIDDNGFIVDYPKLGRRVVAPRPPD